MLCVCVYVYSHKMFKAMKKNQSGLVFGLGVIWFVSITFFCCASHAGRWAWYFHCLQNGVKWLAEGTYPIFCQTAWIWDRWRGEKKICSILILFKHKLSTLQNALLNTLVGFGQFGIEKSEIVTLHNYLLSFWNDNLMRSWWKGVSDLSSFRN